MLVGLSELSEECLGRNVPIALVGIGDEESGECPFVESPLFYRCRIGEGFSNFCGIDHQLAVDGFYQLTDGFRRWDGQHQRCLSASRQCFIEPQHVAVGIERVATGTDFPPVAIVCGQQVESLHACDAPRRSDLDPYGIDIVVPVDIEVGRFFIPKKGRAHGPVQVTACQAGDNNQAGSYREHRMFVSLHLFSVRSLKCKFNVFTLHTYYVKA